LQTHSDAPRSESWWETWTYVPNDFAERLKATILSKRLKIAWRDKVTSINLVQCDLDNVLCKSGGLGVMNAGEVMGLAAVILLGACQLMSIQFVGMLGFTLFLPFSLVTFFALSHGVSPWCFPMCIYDDFVDISETTFTKHIVWPEGLVQRDELERLDGVLNCKDLAGERTKKTKIKLCTFLRLFLLLCFGRLKYY
jgi:hypothetical protein